MSSEMLETRKRSQPELNVAHEESGPQYLPNGRLAVVFVGFLMSVLLTTMDQTIVSTALPKIVSAFNGLEEVTWVATAYFLTQGGFILIVGQILTVASKKKVLLIAIFIFELGSLLCAVSRSMSLLIFGRAVAGCGAAGIQIAVTTTIPDIAPLHIRPILFSLFGAILGLSSVVGPLVGGALTDKATWRWCFWINLPLGGLAAILVFVFLRLRPSALDGVVSKRDAWARMDWVGAALGLAFVTCLLLPLQWGGNSKPWKSPTVIALLIVFAVILAMFIFWERLKGPSAMMPLNLLRNRTQMGCFLSGFCGYISLFMGTYYLPLWYQARGASATKSGLNILPFLISVVASAAVSGTIVTKTGRYWWILLICPLFTAVGSGLLFTIKNDTPLARLIGFQIFYGIGIGTVFQNVLIAIQAEYALEEHMIPQATSVVSFGQLLGGVVGLAIAGSVFGNSLRSNLRGVDLPDELKNALEQSVTVVFTLPPDLRGIVTNLYVKSLDPVFLIGIPAAILASASAILIANHNLHERTKLATAERIPIMEVEHNHSD